MSGTPVVTPEMTVAELAELVRRDWGTKLSPCAAPYLDAMLTLRSVDDAYYNDSGRSVVLYFLSNAGSWRGEVARAVKAELKRRVQ